MTPTTRNPDAGFRPQRMGQRSSSSRGILVVHSDEMPTEHHLPLPTGNSVVHQSGQRPPCLPLGQGAISLCMQTKPSGARVVINSLWVVPVRTGQFHCALVSAPCGAGEPGLPRRKWASAIRGRLEPANAAVMQWAALQRCDQGHRLRDGKKVGRHGHDADTPQGPWF